MSESAGAMRVILIPGLEGHVPQSIQNYHHHLARNLQKEYRAEVVVESFSPRLAWLPRDRRLRANYLDLAKLLLVPAQLRRLRADVFHVLDQSHGAWAPPLGGRRVVVTCHDLIPLVRPEMWRTAWGRGFGRRMFEWNVRRMLQARAVIAVSDATRRDIARLLGTPAGCFPVVPMAVDPERFHPWPPAERRAARDRLGLPTGRPILLHVGGCDHYKNVGGALRVLARVRRELPDALLVKVGAPFPAREAALIASLDLHRATHHLGRLEMSALVDAYHAADVLLFPSLYEGFGLPVLEAMACGTPVVASNAGSLPEVAGDGAVLCAPADEAGMAQALVGLLADAGERERLGQQGVSRSREFRWERTARLTFECYSRVTQGER